MDIKSRNSHSIDDGVRVQLFINVFLALFIMWDRERERAIIVWNWNCTEIAFHENQCNEYTTQCTLCNVQCTFYFSTDTQR